MALLLQMKRTNTVDSKLLVKLEATQRQIGAQIAELQGVATKNAAENGKALDRVRTEILGAVEKKQKSKGGLGLGISHFV